jgi:hypothetical protein
METLMFACALILILLLPVAFLSTTIEILFSPEELSEMGVHLENSRA